MTNVLSPEDLIDNPEIDAAITAIVHRLVASPEQWEDLIEDGKVFIWQLGIRRPYATMSWYLHALSHHVQDWLRRGPSIDSPERAHLRQPASQFENSDNVPACLVQEEVTVSTTCAHEICDLLRPHLKRRQRDVLRFLVKGFSRRDIARKLGLSEPAIVKICKRFGALLRRFGITLE